MVYEVNTSKTCTVRLSACKWNISSKVFIDLTVSTKTLKIWPSYVNKSGKK